MALSSRAALRSLPDAHYAIEARERAAQFIADTDRRDPYDYYRLEKQVQLLYFATSGQSRRRDEDAAAHRDMRMRGFVYGYNHQPALWSWAWTLAGQDDMETLGAVLNNQTLAHADPIYAHQDILRSLGWRRDNAERALQRVEDPEGEEAATLRARLHELGF